MTEEERKEEGAEELVEDLEAPAVGQGDVVGGRLVACGCDDNASKNDTHGCTGNATAIFVVPPGRLAGG